MKQLLAMSLFEFFDPIFRLCVIFLYIFMNFFRVCLLPSTNIFLQLYKQKSDATIIFFFLMLQSNLRRPFIPQHVVD